MIAVYGATGYTGRLVARELRRRGMTAALCGRSGAKLKALGAELGVDWPLRAARVDDAPALRKALAGSDVVINCAGPFTFYGAPVIEAALDVRAHYVDTTGEQPYMKRVFDFLDAPARARGRAVVPGAGFDYVPGDLLCAAAARGHEPLRELVVAYAVSGFGATRGTLHSALQMLREDEVEYVDGAWRPAGALPLRERFAFPEPIGDQVVARYPGGEVVTAPRHLRTRAVRQRISARSFAPRPEVAGFVPAVTAALGPFLRTPLSAPLDALIDRLPEGPSDEAREHSRFTIVAEARGEDGSTGRAVLQGSDVYGLTAVTAVELARLMCLDGFDRTGARAPAQAVDAEDFLGFLGEHGVSFRREGPAREGERARA
jgi:short subunit dehydrogenase-like uncharacterized protein